MPFFSVTGNGSNYAIDHILSFDQRLRALVKADRYPDIRSSNLSKTRSNYEKAIRKVPVGDAQQSLLSSKSDFVDDERTCFGFIEEIGTYSRGDTTISRG